MVAALDATPLTLTSGGLARYVTQLSLALAREFPEDSYRLLSDQAFTLPPGAPPNLLSTPDTTRDKRWWLRGVRSAIAATGAQVFHGTNFEVPYLGNTPAILTIHDLSPWRDPSWHSGADRVRQRTPWLIRLHRSQLILTVSKAVKAEILSRFGVPEASVRVVPLAAPESFRPAPSAMPEKPYFLFIGTLEPRKNLSALVEAWKATRDETGAELLIAGRTRADFVPIPALDGIRQFGELPDDALPSLFSGALALVYPSLYEGFGLPVLEAMQCGCPVIASLDPAVREVAAGAAVHAGSVFELAEAMRDIAKNAVKRAELREKGLSRAAAFSWARTARETRALYREVIAGVKS